MPQRRVLSFDASQIPAIEAMLAGLKPREALAYRLVIRGLFPRTASRGAWEARIDDLMAKLVKGNVDKMARVLRRSSEAPA